MMDLEALLRAARDDEPGAWDALVPRLLDTLGQYFRRRKFDEPAAAELSQRTLVAVARQLPGFEARESLVQWVYGIANKQILSELRVRGRQGAQMKAMAQIVLRSSTSPTSWVNKQELLAIVLEELEQLSPHYRRAIENDLAGGDVDSLARRENIARATARTRRFRAYELLRRRVAARMLPAAPPELGASTPSS